MELRDGHYWDGDWFLVDWDDLTRRAVFVRDDGDSWAVRTDYHAVDATLDANADFAKEAAGKKMGDWVRIASMPQFVADNHNLDEKLRQGDKAALARFFNDPDHKKWRSGGGRV